MPLQHHRVSQPAGGAGGNQGEVASAVRIGGESVRGVAQKSGMFEIWGCFFRLLEFMCILCLIPVAPNGCPSASDPPQALRSSRGREPRADWALKRKIDSIAKSQIFFPEYATHPAFSAANLSDLSAVRTQRTCWNIVILQEGGRMIKQSPHLPSKGLVELKHGKIWKEICANLVF